MNSMLELVPARDLSAHYDTTKGELTLSAKGNTQRVAYNFTFKREISTDGLKFSLYGWVDHTVEKQPYTYSQAFKVQLPSLDYSSEHVMIIDANRPRGVKIPIYFTGSGPTLPLNEQPQALLPAPPATLTPNSTTINALFQELFQIKESASVPRGGEIDIQFDSTFLELAQATIQDGDIVWAFNSLQTGNTQVIVTVSGGVAQFKLHKVYDIRIFMLNDVAGRKSPATSSRHKQCESQEA